MFPFPSLPLTPTTPLHQTLARWIPSDFSPRELPSRRNPLSSSRRSRLSTIPTTTRTSRMQLQLPQDPLPSQQPSTSSTLEVESRTEMRAERMRRARGREKRGQQKQVSELVSFRKTLEELEEAALPRARQQLLSPWESSPEDARASREVQATSQQCLAELQAQALGLLALYNSSAFDEPAPLRSPSALASTLHAIDP